MNTIRTKNPGEGDNVIVPHMTSVLFRPTAGPILLSLFLVIQCFEGGAGQGSLLHPMSTPMPFLSLSFGQNSVSNMKFEVLKSYTFVCV